METLYKKQFRASFYTLFILCISVVGLVFGNAFIGEVDFLVFLNNRSKIQLIFIVIMSIITVFSIITLFLKKNFLYKTALLVLILTCFVSLFAYLLLEVGFFDKIKSVDDLRLFISGFGKFASIIFILVQFLQVSLLPIPAFITVGAGVLLFGPLKGAILSCIGIIAGSVCAFFIGKIFGYKVACWLVGKEELDKGIKILKGKDKIILTFMFLFPFFPDDALCFVAGLSSMSWQFFLIMMVTTRIISIFASSFSMNNSIIPYDTWWGIIIWIVFFALTVMISILLYKKGNKIQDYFKRKHK